MRSSSPGDSTLIARRPRATARVLRRALADAGKDDLTGRKPQGSATSTSPSELASAWLPRLDQPDHRERRIRFERVMDGVRIPVKCLGPAWRRPRGWRRVIDVTGGAYRRGDRSAAGATSARCRGSGGGHSLDSIPMPLIGWQLPWFCCHVHLGAPPCRLDAAEQITVTLPTVVAERVDDGPRPRRVLPRHSGCPKRCRRKRRPGR